MTRTLVLSLLAFLPFALTACGEKGVGGDGSGSSESGDGDGDGDTTGGPDSSPECDQYLECITKVDPDNAGMAEEKYGPGGSCWSEESAAECSDDCADFTEELRQDNPNALECGGDPLCPGQCCEKGADCNPDFPCCGDDVCFQEGATRCVCTNLPESCTMCTNDCLANMVMPEICEMSCKFLCMPDLDSDPIHCRTW